MNRKLGLLVIILCSALCLSACGGSSVREAPAAVPTEVATIAPSTAAPAPTAFVQKDRSGFDPATNMAFTFAGVRFFIPDYYGEVEKKTTESEVQFTGSTVKDSGKVALLFDKTLVKWTKADYEGNLDEVESRMMKAFSKATKTASQDIQFAENTGRILSLTGSDGTLAEAAFTFNPTTGEFISVICFEEPTAEYNYFPDFERIIIEAVKDETVESPQKDEHPTGTGVSPEFKKMMDSYEAIVDKYVEFMNSFDSSNTNQLMQYLDLLNDYTDFAEKIDAIDEDSLSDADLAYYLEVTTRVSQKMIGALG